MKEKNNWDTIIIGGGASGMMAAIFASQKGKKVLILEKNKSLGEKLKITGGGRCNIFNCEYDQNKLLKFYGDAEKYLRTSFAKFGLEQTEEFFLQIGIETEIEDRKRAFPKSRKAVNVYDALLREIVKNKVEISYESRVEKIYFTEGESKKVSGIKLKKSNEILTADKYILSAGGYSHPETGSTGDGFKFLENEFIKINPANPSLVPLSVTNIWVKKLTGKTIENIKLTFYVDNIKKKVLKPRLATTHQEDGQSNRVLFTHFGLSGPTILNNSKLVSDWLQEGEVTVAIDLFAQLDEKKMDEYLLKIFENNLNKTFKNILNDIYAGNILEEILLETFPDLDLNKKVNDVRVGERKEILRILKNLKINVNGLMGFDKAIIASGGVDVSEVIFSTMQLKKVENLFVTGDMLDISRPSGGFSLQLCWTTGFLAGSDFGL